MRPTNKISQLTRMQGKKLTGMDRIDRIKEREKAKGKS
jgi:hypothetical protein